jgi:hypothetical protein
MTWKITPQIAKSREARILAAAPPDSTIEGANPCSSACHAPRGFNALVTFLNGIGLTLG